jgi:hypothetical protein
MSECFLKQRQTTDHVVGNFSFISEVRTRNFKCYLDKNHQKFLIRARLHDSEARHSSTCLTQ